MPYFDDEARAAWRTANEDLIEFLQVPANQRASRFIASIAQSLETYSSLTDAQTRAARNVMRELTNDSSTGSTDDPTQPAEADDALHIPNGVYTINDGDEHLTYRIHTVRNGALRGKRIIKRQLSYGEFKGFAFVTRQGTVKVWRSFYEDEARSERYIVWARLLVAALGERYSDGYYADAAEFEFTYAEGSGFMIQASVLCRRCNRALTDPTSISVGIGPECRNLEQGPRTTAARAHEPITITADQIAQSSLIADTPSVVISGTSSAVEAQEQRLITACENSRASRFNSNVCDYCGRTGFLSPQGRGRHQSVCRRDRGPDTQWQRDIRRLGEYRERYSLVRNDEWQQRYEVLPRRSGAQPVMRQPVQRTMQTVGAPRTPNLSALGTVFNGAVWEQ